MEQPASHVGFIGLGNMGGAMATRLVRAGFDVTAWNRTASRVDEVVKTIFVSAPAFGRPEAAAAGNLFIVAAGPTAALDTCQPFFEAIGQRTFRFGDRPQAANVVKLGGNFLIASVIESRGEVLALARKSDVDPHKFVDLLTSTLFTAPVYRTYGGLIAQRSGARVRGCRLECPCRSRGGIGRPRWLTCSNHHIWDGLKAVPYNRGFD